MHNSIVIFVIKILRYFRTPAITATSPAAAGGGGVLDSKGDWMLKVLIGNFIIKLIKKGKFHSLDHFVCLLLSLTPRVVVYTAKSKALMSSYLPMPRDLWKNECPIVLVHGFAG